MVRYLSCFFILSLILWLPGCGGFSIKHFEMQKEYTKQYRIPLDRLKEIRQSIILNLEPVGRVDLAQEKTARIEKLLTAKIAEFSENPDEKNRVTLRPVRNSGKTIGAGVNGYSIDRLEIRRLAREHGAELVLIPVYSIRQTHGMWVIDIKREVNFSTMRYCPDQAWEELHFEIHAFTAEGETVMFPEKPLDPGGFAQGKLGKLVQAGRQCKVEPLSIPEIENLNFEFVKYEIRSAFPWLVS